MRVGTFVGYLSLSIIGLIPAFLIGSSYFINLLNNLPTGQDQLSYTIALTIPFFPLLLFGAWLLNRREARLMGENEPAPAIWRGALSSPAARVTLAVILIAVYMAVGTFLIFNLNQMLPVIGGNAPADFAYSALLLAYLPPFAPTLLPTALIARGGWEGAEAGFVGYGILFLGFGSLINGPACYNACGFDATLLFLGVVLGAEVGVAGGRIGRTKEKHLQAGNPKKTA